MSDQIYNSPFQGYDDGVHGLAKLGRNAIKRVSELERGIAERDETIRQLRARLDEYEQAPTVAVVKGEYGLDLTYRYPFSDKPPPVGTELIARPTRKDGE